MCTILRDAVKEAVANVQAAVEILGKRKGEQMAMLVHHSRNSVQKQWEETLVLALSGMGRILRAHLPVLVDMPGFSQVCAYAPATGCCMALLQVSEQPQSRHALRLATSNP